MERVMTEDTDSPEPDNAPVPARSQEVTWLDGNRPPPGETRPVVRATARRLGERRTLDSALLVPLAVADLVIVASLLLPKPLLNIAATVIVLLVLGVEFRRRRAQRRSQS
jgi:Flp pilus assembly protein TadB